MAGELISESTVLEQLKMKAEQFQEHVRAGRIDIAKTVKKGKMIESYYEKNAVENLKKYLKYNSQK